MFDSNVFSVKFLEAFRENLLTGSLTGIIWQTLSTQQSSYLNNWGVEKMFWPERPAKKSCGGLCLWNRIWDLGWFGQFRVYEFLVLYIPIKLKFSLDFKKRQKWHFKYVIFYFFQKELCAGPNMHYIKRYKLTAGLMTLC